MTEYRIKTHEKTDNKYTIIYLNKTPFVCMKFRKFNIRLFSHLYKSGGIIYHSYCIQCMISCIKICTRMTDSSDCAKKEIIFGASQYVCHLLIFGWKRVRHSLVCSWKTNMNSWSSEMSTMSTRASWYMCACTSTSILSFSLFFHHSFHIHVYVLTKYMRFWMNFGSQWHICHFSSIVPSKVEKPDGGQQLQYKIKQDTSFFLFKRHNIV